LALAVGQVEYLDTNEGLIGIAIYASPLKFGDAFAEEMQHLPPFRGRSFTQPPVEGT